MNWYLQSSEDCDVVKSSRIRLARNLNGFKFNLENKSEIEQLENKIKDNLYSIGYGLKYLKLKDMDDITKMSLVEKNLISPEFALNKSETGSILINDEENICIMIGGKDHINIQVFNCGLDLENTLNLAIEIDKKIEDLLGYAINKKYGYLTSSLGDIGTGLKASVIVHLPALAKTKNIRKVLEAISSFGMNIRGMYGENNQVQGDIYQISNKQTLGITEQDIAKNMKAIVDKVIEQERLARKYLCKNSLELEDKVYRALGILTNARFISSEEAETLMSKVKLGTDLGIISELDDAKVKKLELYIKPANLQKYYGRVMDEVERDSMRAKVIKEIIKS